MARKHPARKRAARKPAARARRRHRPAAPAPRSMPTAPSRITEFEEDEVMI